MNIMHGSAELQPAVPQAKARGDLPSIPLIDLRQLHHLSVLAECGSISGAAALLGIAQPSLSELLSRMETRLGVQLVIRHGRGIQMTEAGRLLAFRAHSLLTEVEAAVDDARGLNDEAVGSLTVGISHSLGMTLSIPLAETVRTELPGVKLRIVEGLSGDLSEWVASGRLDLACIVGSPPGGTLLQQQIASEQLFIVSATDNWSGAVGPDGIAAQSVALKDLGDYSMAMPSAAHGARREIELAVRAAGGRLSIAMEIDSLQQIIALVDRASTYGLLSRASVLQYVTSGRLMLVPTWPKLERPIFLVSERSRAVSKAEAAVGEMMKMILRETIDRHKLEATMLAA